MKNITFSSTKNISKAVTTLLYIGVGLSLISVVLSYVQLIVYPDIWAVGVELSPNEVIFVLAAVGVSFLNVSVYFGTIVTFLIWLHRSYNNLLAFGVNGLKASPGWAVGYWFIPILNLFKPLSIVNEVWNNSGYRQGGSRRISYSNTSLPMLHVFWWFAWIVSNVSGYISMKLVWDTNNSGVENSGTLVATVFDVTSILAAFCLIKIVANITQKQEINAAAQQFHMPPKPPRFHMPPEPPNFD